MGTIRKAFEIYFNMLNHICIGIVAVHVTWYCIQMQLTGKFYIEYHLHVWLSTIGVRKQLHWKFVLFFFLCKVFWFSLVSFPQYQILMAEAILTLYSSNGWSFFHSPNTKKTLHWVLQVVGSVMAIAGTVILYPKRTKHFLSIHSITGLVSMILIVVSVINGILAHRRPSFYRKVKIRPVVFKIFHNFTGIATFVIGKNFFFIAFGFSY